MDDDDFDLSPVSATARKIKASEVLAEAPILEESELEANAAQPSANLPDRSRSGCAGVGDATSDPASKSPCTSLQRAFRSL